MRALMVVVGLCAGAAVAAGKTVILAAGDCGDPALVNASRDFREGAARLLGDQLLPAEGVLDIVRPRPTRALQDIERQVESARALFYSGQPERALELVQRALAELERATPDSKPWPVVEQAFVLTALIEKNLEHPKEMSEALRRIVRLDARFRLDADAHPPTVLAALEAVKKEVARARKATLDVRVSAGPAATVYIDGQPMGSTPLKLDLPAGSYRVSLLAPGLLSFPHRVELPRDGKLSVDLAFEGSVSQQVPLCLSGADDGAAIKLAQLVTAEAVIVLRNTARNGAPTVLSGVLFELPNVQQARGGSVPPELAGKLATFLVTGKKQPGVDPVGGAGEPAPAAPTPQAEKPSLSPPTAEPAPVPLALQPTFEVAAPASTGRKASFALLGAGGGLVAVGALLYALGEPNRTRFNNILVQGKFTSSIMFPIVFTESLNRMQATDINNALAFGCIGAGVGAALAGVVGLALFPDAPVVSAAAGPAGGSVQLSGRF